MESLANPKSASKRVLSLLVVFMTTCTLISTVASLGAISAKAIDPADTVTISRDTIHMMLDAGGLPGYYHAVGDVLSPFSFTYSNNNADFYFPDGDDAGLHHFLSYYASTSGWNPIVGSPAMVGLVPVNLHFQHVTYISFDMCIGITTSAYQYEQVSLADARQYLTLCVGESVSDIVPIGARTPTGGYSNFPARGYWGWAQQDWGRSGCALFRVTIERDSPADLYIGDLDFGYINPSASTLNSERRMYWGISDITINSGYTYVGRDAPPATPPVPPTPSGDIPGSGSGTIVTDTSGNINFDFHMTQVLPDYIYQGSYSVSSEDMPQTISSAVSALDSYGTTAIAAVSEFASDVNASGLLGQMSNFLTPKLIVYIMGINALCIVGWILTRYGGGGA